MSIHERSPLCHALKYMYKYGISGLKQRIEENKARKQKAVGTGSMGFGMLNMGSSPSKQKPELEKECTISKDANIMHNNMTINAKEERALLKAQKIRSKATRKLSKNIKKNMHSKHNYDDDD